MTNPKTTHGEHQRANKTKPEQEIEKQEQEIGVEEIPVEQEVIKEKPEPEESADTKYLRLMADFQNYKRRSEKERTEIHAFANEKLVTQLLEVLDNFERALQQDPGSDEQFRNGMTLIIDQFKTVLNKAGVAEIPAAEAEFNPNFHHAIMMENAESIKSGHVSMVLQKGYTMNGKVIRPAIVKVAE
jgi:molecular chaperone GrpE